MVRGRKGTTGALLLLSALAIAFTPALASASSTPQQRQTQALVGFNGYYALDISPDAFFYVNSTMRASDGGARQRYTISLDLSLDGKTSYSAKFDGTFRNNRLVQRSKRGPTLDLRFTRISKALGPTARIVGKVSLPGQQLVAVTGTTYSNPTPAAFWGGQTYYAAAAPGGQPTPTVRMTRNGGIYYRSGSPSRWVRARSYTYNLDMYYFSLSKNLDLVMGTGGQSGKVASEFKTVAGVQTQNELLTLPNAQPPTTGSTDWYPSLSSDPMLGDFSGYYPIPTARNPNAFVSIEGRSLADPSLSPDDLYQVLISVSTDGRSVSSWYFNPLGGMTFDGSVLEMPAQGITLRFERRYDRATRALFTMRGTIGKRAVGGQSTFNSIPASAFAGTMTDSAGQHELVITPTGEVTLDGQSIPNYLYVPTMYILAGPLPDTTPDSQPETVLSLGFSGANGRTAIVTTAAGTPQSETFTLSAIPSS